MAYIQEKVKGKKIVSFKIKACLGRDANGKQLFKCTTWYPPADLTPAKARKEVQKVAGVWEEEVKQNYIKEQEARAVAGELPPPAPVYTFDTFVNEVWVPLCVRDGSHRPATVAMYTNILKIILPQFQGVPMTEISGVRISQYLRWLRNEYRKPNGKPLAEKSIKHHYNVLNLIFGYAERQDIIPKNPMKKVDTPKVSKKDVDALTEEEAVRFFDALLACDFEFRCILQVLITTGLRRGECLGLQWTDMINHGKQSTNYRLTNAQTIKQYRRNIDKFCDWLYKTFGIVREHEIEKLGFSKQTLIQKYADMLVARGLAAAIIHTYLAPVCKSLGVGMECIQKPSPLSKYIKKNTKRHQNVAGARQEADPANMRIIRFAQVVTVRPRALVRLSAENVQKDEYGDSLVVVRDKGGKDSAQLLMPHEVAFVKEVLSTDAEGKKLQPGARPFSPKDLKQIAFSKYRIQRAQDMEAYFSQMFNAWKNMQRKTPEQQRRREQAKAEAMAEKQKWIDKIVSKYARAHPAASKQTVQRYRERLENPSPICVRAGNRERAMELQRPTEYDRVSVRIASVYALSHWENESTIRNYLTK